MYISEHTFDQLRHAEAERLSRELEYRRIAYERQAETPTATGGGFRDLVRRFRHAPQPASRRLSHP